MADARETRTALTRTKKCTGARMRRAADTSLDVSTFQGIIGLISRVHCAHASNELRELFTIISPFFAYLSLHSPIPLVHSKLRRIIYIFKTSILWMYGFLKGLKIKYA